MIRLFCLIYFAGFVAGGVVFKTSSGGCATPIATEAECMAVGNFQAETPGALSHAPTGCYKMGQFVKWDADANNTGDCTVMVNCVCDDGANTTPPPTVMIAAPNPTVNITPPPTPQILSTPPPTPIIIVTTTGDHDTWKVITSDETCDNILTADECQNAANHLGLGDGSVVDDNQTGASWDPPFCYYEWGQVKFNNGGTNTGGCTSVDMCLCAADIVYAQIESGPECGAFDVITTVGECFAAAKRVIHSDSAMPIVDDSSSANDPPYCYYEAGELKFNESGSNTGECSENDVCICKFEEQDVVKTVVDELMSFPNVQEVRIEHIHEEDAPNENTVDVSLFLKVHADCPHDQACTNASVTLRRLLGE